MSTRSGKRIHNTVDENTIENIVDNKNERNTRSKRQKINSDLPLTEKKRKHYVRYPSEENITNDDNENIENMVKSTRMTRRHTLKEQNILATDSETSNDERKAVRSTRRTKKFEAPDELQTAEPNLEKAIREGKKKGKKKKTKQLTKENTENIPETETVTHIKKKTNKKKNKRKSNSLIVEDISEAVNNKNLNRSNGSIDSFHSAAGSPVANYNECPTNGVSDPAKTGKNKKKICSEEAHNTSTDKPNRKRKLNKEVSCEVPNGHIADNLSKNESTSVSNNQENANESENSMPKLNQSSEICPKKRRSNKKSKHDKTDDKNITFEIDNINKGLDSSNIKLDTKPTFNNTFDNNSEKEKINLNATFNKETSNQSEQGINNITYSGSKQKRKSSIKNSTYDKIDNVSAVNLDATYEKESQSINKNLSESQTKDLSPSKHSLGQNNIVSLNNTYDKNSKTSSPNSFNATFDKQPKLDTTFDKSLKKDSINQSTMKPQAKSSLISSDTTDNSTLNITDDNSRISITSDESKTENIVNTTPVLIESSMDESKTNENTFTMETKKTPLRREGTFTDETKKSSNPEDIAETISVFTPLKRDATFTEMDISPKETNLSEIKSTTPHKNKATKTPPSAKKITDTKPTTPLKREGTFTKDSSDVTMSPNVKLSTQLTPRRKSLPSPGCTPFPLSKSSSKEKSVLNVTRSIEKSRRSSVADVAPRMTRVMFCSPVNNPAVVSQMKGKVIKSNLKGSNKSFVFDESVSELSRPARKRSYTQSEESEREAQLRSCDRLSRSRTTSAAARLQDAGSPSKKPKPEGRRTKLPNFAALHQKQFQRMESLDECVLRKAKRARRLLTPSTPNQTLRTSPKEPQKDAPKAEPTTKKIETPKSKQAEPNSGFTRFGFKLNLDVNPFSFPKSTEVKPKEKQPVILKRQATLPSLAGATTLRREIAKQTIMREKSFTEKRHVKRDETRTVIKGVRTNRRFELQMKMRNINNK